MKEVHCKLETALQKKKLFKREYYITFRPGHRLPVYFIYLSWELDTQLVFTIDIQILRLMQNDFKWAQIL